MNKCLKIGVFLLCLYLLVLAFSACMLEGTPANSETPSVSSPTETDIDTGTGETSANTMTFDDGVISTSIFQVNGTNLSLTVPNATEVFSFLDQITLQDNAKWQISTDIYGNNVIVTKTVLLKEGDNVFYLLVSPDKDEMTTLYTVTIRRKPNYTICFEGGNSEVIDSISVEEGKIAEPSSIIPNKTGFEFAGWEFDFTKPIQEEITIEAKWTPIEYYITYDLNGGQSIDNPSTYRIIDDIELSAPSRDGYVFLGWYSTDGERIENVHGMSVPLTLTAKWECYFTVKKGVVTGVSDYFRRNVLECIVPPEIDGETITGIAGQSNTHSHDGAFYNCSLLTSITLPSTIVRIGTNAFDRCTALRSVYFLGSIADWCRIEFPSNPLCFAHNLYINGEPVIDLVIPEGVTSIGNGAFQNCIGLTSISISDSVTNIGASAFAGCTGLSSVTIPDNVITMGGSAFSGCIGLKNAIIGNGIITVGNFAFNGCSELISVTIGNGVWNIDDHAFRDCTNLISVSIGNCVTRIGNYAFNNCFSLSSIVIPDSVTSIGEYAFEYCIKLKKLTLGNGLIRIGENAFSLCYGLTTITVPNSVTDIQGGAFYGCNALGSVTIGSGVTKIGEYAFSDCYGLVEIRNMSALTITAGSRDNGDIGLNALRVYSTGDSCVHIDENGFVFYDDGDVIVLVGYSGDLTELSLPKNYQGRSYSIHRCVFYDFNNNFSSNLSSITIPDTVVSIGEYVFGNCKKLTNVIFLGTTTQWDSIIKGEGWNYGIGTSVVHCSNGDVSFE